MRFNSVRTGDYSQSAKAVTRSADQIFDTAMSNVPDFTAISKEAIKGRSAERRAVTRAEGEVAAAGIRAFRDTKLTKMRADTAKDVRDILRPAKRMAGIVAGLGAISGAALMHKNIKEDKAERASLRAEQDAINQKTTEMFDAQQEAWKAIQTQLQGTLTDTSQSSTDTSGTQPSNSGSGSTPSGGTPASTPSGGTPASTPAPSSGTALKLTPGKPITQQQGVQLLINQGMDPENARIGGAVMMAESRGKPGALNSNGEYSLGLWQHNRDTGEDRRGFYGINDWSELSDPETNARATYRLWKRQGGWTPWGAFTNGSYKDFL